MLVTRDILADAASTVADQANSVASTIRPSKTERDEGVDFEAAQKKGKKVVRDVKKGKAQKETRDSLYEEMESAKEYLDDKLPSSGIARDAVIKRFQQVRAGSIVRRSVCVAC